jgi:hypothetical protein
MREIVSPLDGFGSPFGTRSKPQIITAIIRPALAPIVSGDTVEDALSEDVDQTSNYASTAGTIATVQVDILVNGEVPAALDIPLDAGDTIALTVTVTDSEANVRVFTASRVVGAVAPTNDVAPSIAGDTALGDVLTVTAGTWSGDPAPTLSYQWRRDGAAIAGETGTTYTITLADSGADIDVLETATNSAGSASEASNAITADTFTAPDAFTAPDWGLANDDGDISVNILTLPDDGGAPITDLEYRVNAGAAVSFGETTTGSYPIVADEDDEIQIRAVNAVGAGDWSDVKVVPAAVALDPDAAAYIAAVETADTQALEPAVQTAINDFVVGCKTDGIWNAIKASCIMAGARTLAGALVPLKGPAPTNFNFVSADYNRKTGLKGDGSTKYLDSNRNNNADPQNNNHNAVFATEIPATSTSDNFFGSDGVGVAGGNNMFQQPIGSLAGANRGTGSGLAFNISGQGLTLGLKGFSRSVSASYVVRSGEVNRTVTVSSSTPTSEKIAIFARTPSAPAFYIAARLSFYSIGEALDLAALDARVSALMTAIEGALP